MAQKVQKPKDIAAEFDTLPDTAGVSDQTIAALRNVSRNTVWRWARCGILAKPTKTLGTTRWLAGDVRKAFNLPARAS